MNEYMNKLTHERVIIMLFTDVDKCYHFTIYYVYI